MTVFLSILAIFIVSAVSLFEVALHYTHDVCYLTNDSEQMQATSATSDAELTKRQAQVLASIRAFWKRKKYSPSIRDVAKAGKFGNPNGAYSVLLVLERKGYITMDQGVSRSIVLVENGNGTR